MLLHDRNDLNTDSDDSTPSQPGSLQVPGASVLAQKDRGASGKSGTPAQSLPAPLGGTTGSRSRMRERPPLGVWLEDQSLGEDPGSTLPAPAHELVGGPCWLVER